MFTFLRNLSLIFFLLVKYASLGSAFTSPLSTSKIVSRSTSEAEISSTVVRLPGGRGTRVRLFYPEDLRKGPNTENGSSTKKDDLALLIYSHDIKGNMDIAESFFREIVLKRNNVVAAIEHLDGTAAPFTERKDGSKLKFAPYLMTERLQLTSRAQDLLAAVQFLPRIINQLYYCQQSIGLPSCGDEKHYGNEPSVVNHILLGGLGWGATSCVMAANGQPKVTMNSIDDSSSSTPATVVSGLILHDPILGMGYGMLPPNKSYNRLPTVTYVSEQYYKKFKIQYGTRTIKVKGCRHEHFYDGMLPSLIRPQFLRGVDPAALHVKIANCMTAFLQSLDPNSSVLIANEDSDVFEVIR